MKHSTYDGPYHGSGYVYSRIVTIRNRREPHTSGEEYCENLSKSTFLHHGHEHVEITYHLTQKHEIWITDETAVNDYPSARHALS